MKKRYMLVLAAVIFVSFSSASAVKSTHLVILHTNDTHSQVDPIEPNAINYPGQGGYARRMGLMEKIRKEEKNVLLFDAGDFSQGTPYFNFYNGRVEIDAMNRMKYDAGTLGNHEFDNGVDTLSVILKKAAFPIVCSNYKVDGTPLQDIIKPYYIIKVDNIRIGIMALDVDPNGLVIKRNFEGVIYEDPVKKAQEMSGFLHSKMKCDVIVCLSHLGTKSSGMNDYVIARNTSYIDVIISAHSHELKNDTVENKDGRKIVIAQEAKSGAYLGRIDLTIEK